MALRPILLHYVNQACKQDGGLSCDACISLARIDTDISATRAKLDEQLAARHSLLTQLNTKHDPMGNRLPVEITSKIFQHCLPDLPSPETFENSSRESNTDHEFSQTTAKLTSINRHWRSIAHSTPELWTSIFLNFTRWSISGDRLPIILTNVKQRIQRSSNLLLSIRLIAGEGHALVSSSAQMLEAFCLEAHRWRSLCISAPRKVISVILTQTFPKGPTNSTIVSFLDFLPRLMTLECQICNGDQTFNSNPPLLHPSLKTLKLTAIEAVPNLLAKITLPALEIAPSEIQSTHNCSNKTSLVPSSFLSDLAREYCAGDELGGGFGFKIDVTNISPYPPRSSLHRLPRSPAVAFFELFLLPNMTNLSERKTYFYSSGTLKLLTTPPTQCPSDLHINMNGGLAEFVMVWRRILCR
ncbi:hypothetical protein CPB83DRAFT_836106 [Crepidotus variabilis]|uniref:F-box domain-containing protein n=1 Tax=Crepidotus variabilis TaxID=179855 RepID=A0A9P6JQ29_9AGAR|nr:hypothetical protein CPB83DRAFT_836106 [Crepidotus variabilis]